MKMFIVNRKWHLFICIALLITLGVHGTSEAQENTPTLTASVEDLSDLEVLTEEILDGSTIVLTLSRGKFVWLEHHISRALTVTGIEGATRSAFWSSIDRVGAGTKVTFPIRFRGNLDTDKSLVITVGPEAIVDYDGPALTAEIPVFAVKESLEASTEFPLTSNNLHGNIVTLTLSGRKFRSARTVANALDFSGAGSVEFSVERISDTKVNLEIEYVNIDKDATLVLTVDGSAFNYNKSFTFEFPVTLLEINPILTASFESPTTEAELNFSTLILTLSEGKFIKWSRDIADALTFSGIRGVSVRGRYWGIAGGGTKEVEMTLRFAGNIDEDTPLIITVEPEAIVSYNGPALTAEILVSAGPAEALEASTASPLTEDNLHGNIVTLTLSGRKFLPLYLMDHRSEIEDYFDISDTGYVSAVDRVSDTEVDLTLVFDEDIDTDTTITLTVRGAAIGYHKSFTFEFPVTAKVETETLTLTASASQPLTEATLHRSRVTLTLGGAPGYLYDIDTDEGDVFASGIEGVGLYSDTDSYTKSVNVRIYFSGSMNTDGTLTFTIPWSRTRDYKGPRSTPLTAQIPVKDSVNMRGPWLWMAVPTNDENEKGISMEIDSLAAASNGTAKEADIAKNGVNAGDSVGALQWIDGNLILPAYSSWSIWSSEADNLNETLNLLGFGTGDAIIGHTAYALTYVISPSNQQGTLYVKTNDGLKVWLNGQAVHRHSSASREDTSSVPVTLKAGHNLLLVKARQHGEYWDMGVELDVDGVAADVTTATSISETGTPQRLVADTTLSLTPSAIESPAVGEQLALNLNITGGEAVAGYQASVLFDTTALRYVSSTNGDYLPAGAFFVEPIVAGNLIKLNAASLAGESNGDGTLATLTFEVIAKKTSTVALSNVLLTNRAGAAIVPEIKNAEITEATTLEAATALDEDVNGDGVVNIQDLVLVASNLDQRGENAADVNGDGIVNIQDLVLVAGALGGDAAAPSLNTEVLSIFTAADVQLWLSQAQHLMLADATSQRGIIFLEQLLAALTPKETALLANFPNPFNPETWIPYQLAKPANVTLTIYSANGTVVRTLVLGNMPAGRYQSRSRAAYWDGRNAVGEKVASGLYFYTLTAGEFTATRKMLIRK